MKIFIVSVYDQRFNNAVLTETHYFTKQPTIADMRKVTWKNSPLETILNDIGFDQFRNKIRHRSSLKKEMHVGARFLWINEIEVNENETQDWQT